MVVTRLVESLKDSSPDVRRTAALSLGKIGHPNSIPALITALGDTDPLVREYCAWALGQIESDLTDDAAIALIMALGDESPGVKMSASLALGIITPQKPLIKLLKEALAISEDRTKIAVLQALTQFDDPSTYPIFLVALDDKNPDVRQWAVAGLGELANRRALPYLRNHLLHDPDEGVRTEAAFRIGKLGNKSDITVLETAAQNDSSPIVHLWANWAIQEIKPVQLN